MTVSGISSNAAISALLASEQAAAFAAGKHRANDIVPVKEALARDTRGEDTRRAPIQITSAATRTSPEDERRARRGSATDSGALDGSGADRAEGTKQTQTEAVAASTLFLVQLFGQEEVGPAAAPGLPGLAGEISNRSDAAALGSQHYRQSGGEPALLTEQATFLRIAV